jgi:hypothetical protein
VIFLGKAREERLERAQDAGRLERLGLAWLTAGCVLLGLFPASAIEALDPVPFSLVGRGLAQSGRAGNWLMLAPVSDERASYSAPLVFVLIAAIVLVTFLGVRRFYHGRVRRAAAWDCGTPFQGARMQDTAEGFGQPIRQIFEPFFRMQRELPAPADEHPRYRVTIEDPMWGGIFMRIAAATDWASRMVGKLQRGRISIYLLYSFITLVALLFLTQA